jgi:DNA (cytosine-5)-methyltransferase 1
MTLSLGGLFSGIGGIEYAFTAAGFSVSWMVEINPFCQHVLRKHWPHARIHGDVHTVGNLNLAPVDVLTAGFPCQPFSIAGNQRGEDDPRYLWPELHRVISELRPRVVFLENVPNLRNIAAGSAFNSLLRQLAEIGYNAEWGCLRAADIGAPHIRERLFIVAYTSRFRQSEPPTRNAAPDRERHDPARQPAGRAEFHAALAGGQNVVNPGSSGWRESDPSRVTGSAGHTAGRFAQEQGSGLSESGLGINPDGLSAGLAGHRFPAGQGTFQYDYEPSRTVTQKTAWHKAKIEAIGNAVVPQCIYPLALSIRDYLTG